MEQRREEIIKKYDLRFEEMTKAKPEEYISVKLRKAMDEYAKEIAIDFDDWKIAQNWRQSTMHGYWCQGFLYENSLTSGQLFDLYQQETSSLK